MKSSLIYFEKKGKIFGIRIVPWAALAEEELEGNSKGKPGGGQEELEREDRARKKRARE